ncbi:hypothetical protein GGF37_006893, partial [Kickxella alabastrina]
ALRRHAGARMLGHERVRMLAEWVDLGYWPYKFHVEVCESVAYGNPWTFRALWEHVHPNEDFAVWFALALASIGQQQSHQQQQQNYQHQRQHQHQADG